jgi:hypothetical protein
MAKPAKDNRPAWSFFYDARIGKVRPLCGKQKGPPKRQSRKNAD